MAETLRISQDDVGSVSNVLKLNNEMLITLCAVIVVCVQYEIEFYFIYKYLIPFILHTVYTSYRLYFIPFILHNVYTS